MKPIFEFMKNLINSKKVKKPWGYYQVLLKGTGWWFKKIHLKHGRISLQEHDKRGEIWVISHKGLITSDVDVDDTTKEVKITGWRNKYIEFEIYLRGDFGINQLPGPKGTETLLIHFNTNTLHRISGKVDVYELGFGDPDENDIKRIEDDYGRIIT